MKKIISIGLVIIVSGAVLFGCSQINEIGRAHV